MHASISPTPPGALELLADEVETQLQTRLGGRVRDFYITAREDALTLHGSVRSYYGKLMVQEVVMKVSGLLIEANHIKVFCGSRGT